MERFWSKVDRAGECWIWTGCTQAPGYGRFRTNGQTVYAHRFAYEQEHGAIPPGLVLDHLCRTPACVNPAHLEPVPQRVNVQRGDSYWRKKDRCIHGHLFDGVDARGNRTCRTCKNAASRRYKNRQRA